MGIFRSFSPLRKQEWEQRGQTLEVGENRKGQTPEVSLGPGSEC